MARPRNTDRPRDMKFSLPESIALQIETFTLDVYTGNPTVGLRSKVTTALWEELLSHVATGQPFSPDKAANLIRNNLKGEMK